MATKNLKILGIDTSCDDTGIALIEAKDFRFKVLSNVVSSQVKLHKKYGGVYPFLAKREHQRNLPIVFNKALRKAGFAISNFQFPISKQIPNFKSQISNIDLIGVTTGPGLEPCLWQGVNFAQDLAKKLKKPLIPVNHIEAHILANFINRFPTPIKSIKFPAMCLVVSGGHTQLILMKAVGKYELIGETRDDAAGECLDKVARILRLGYPGGPAIARESAKSSGNPSSATLPRPMISQKNYDFSFSGLKTAVLYKVREGKYDKMAMAAEVQQSVIDVLISKTLKAARSFKVKSIILGGGVTANQELRKQFGRKIEKEIPDSKFYIPDAEFCTDNAAMIAITAYFHRRERAKNIKANANLRI